MLGQSTRMSAVRAAFIVVLIGCHNLHARQLATHTANASEGGVPSSYATNGLAKWMKLGGELPTRDEGRTAFSFRKGDDNSYALNRLPVNPDLTPQRWFHAFVQGQDSRVIGIDPSRESGNVKSVFDLGQGCVELKDGERSSASLKVERQQSNRGTQRLVGSDSWGNVTRTFDGVQIGLKDESAHADLLTSSRDMIGDSRFDTQQIGYNLRGIYGPFGTHVARATTISAFSAKPHSTRKSLWALMAVEGVLQTADVVTTKRGLDIGATEGNPLHGGHPSVARMAGQSIVGAAVMDYLVWRMDHRGRHSLARWLLIGCIGAESYAVTNNIVVIHRLLSLQAQINALQNRIEQQNSGH